VPEYIEIITALFPQHIRNL